MEFKRAEYHSPGEPGKRGFEDLECYRLALEVMVNSYELSRNLPPEEKYDLAVQIRRSAKSISANIAEGYGRYHYLDSLKHYSIARGELNETLSHLINARVLAYVDDTFFEPFYCVIRRAEAALNGFMNYVRKQRVGSKDFGDRSVHEEASDYFIDPIHEEEM